MMILYYFGNKLMEFPFLELQLCTGLEGHTRAFHVVKHQNNYVPNIVVYS